MIRCLFCRQGFLDYADMDRWNSYPAHRGCIAEHLEAEAEGAWAGSEHADG